MWFCLFWGQLSICIDQVGWPQTCDPSVSVSQVLGLKGHKTTFGFNELFYTPFWADIYWMLSPLQHTLIGWATFPVCHSHLWPGTGILGSTMLYQLYTPNMHFPSPSSSSPVGTPLMTRVADDKPKRREVECRGPQPLRHAPGSVTESAWLHLGSAFCTGHCRGTSASTWLCWSSSHLKSCLLQHTGKKCCAHAERSCSDRLPTGEPFRTAVSPMPESIAVSSACLEQQWPLSRCQAKPAKFSKIMRKIKGS